MTISRDDVVQWIADEVAERMIESNDHSVMERNRIIRFVSIMLSDSVVAHFDGENKRV